MSDTDLIKLYSQRILALAADMPHAERLAEPHATAQKRSPLCGSTVIVDVRVDANRLVDLGMDVKACALGQASSSLLGQSAIGRSRDEIAADRDALRAMLSGAEAAPELFEVLTPAVEYKNRHASILLAWEAVVEAMDAARRDGAAATSRAAM